MAGIAVDNQDQITTLERKTGKVVTQWGRGGRGAGQFIWVNNLPIDSRGNLFTAEVGCGRRAQKFKRLT